MTEPEDPCTAPVGRECKCVCHRMDGVRHTTACCDAPANALIDSWSESLTVGEVVDYVAEGGTLRLTDQFGQRWKLEYLGTFPKEP